MELAIQRLLTWLLVELNLDMLLDGVSPQGNTGAIAAGGSPNLATTEEWAFSGIPPTAPAAGYSDAIVGQMYYNSTSGQFKGIKRWWSAYWNVGIKWCWLNTPRGIRMLWFCAASQIASALIALVVWVLLQVIQVLYQITQNLYNGYSLD